MNLKWSHPLSSKPLCVPPETCSDQYMVNAVAVSDNATRAVGATYYQNYDGTTRTRVDGTFGTYCYNAAGTLLFKDEFAGDKGVYAVAMSGDGKTAAGGGLFTMGKQNAFKPKRGLLRAYAVPSGNSLLDNKNFADRVTSIALSRTGKVLAAVAERMLSVFIRTTGSFTAPPQTFQLDGYCETLAVHPSGKWLAAADHKGRIYVFTITRGTVQPPKKWIAREPESTLPNSPKRQVKFHSVSIARESDFLVAGGKDFVYLLSPDSVSAPKPGPLARFTSFDATGHHDVRWVAIADDASFMTAVMNDHDGTGTPNGRLVKLSRNGAVLQEDWRHTLDHLPNSTSIDGSGTRITAADGYPDDVPGIFYLFDETGAELGRHNTVKMCWPMSIAKNGTGIVGGDDNNTMFFFQP